MKQVKFQPNDGRPAITVSSLEEIKQYMGEIMYGFNEIEVIDGNIVVTYLDGMPVTLGYII